MSNGKRVLVGCEYSGIVRSAFEKLGWDAWSCDLLPTEIPGNHYQCDLLEIFEEKQHWDLGIFFPMCTFLTYAGTAHWTKPGRTMKRIEAAKFFMKCYDSDINNVAVENPLGVMNKIFREPDQMIHPFYFGDNDLKRTCLWLKNIPKLKWVKENDLFENRTSVNKPPPPTYSSEREKKIFYRFNQINFARQGAQQNISGYSQRNGNSMD